MGICSEVRAGQCSERREYSNEPNVFKRCILGSRNLYVCAPFISLQDYTAWTVWLKQVITIESSKFSNYGRRILSFVNNEIKRFRFPDKQQKDKTFQSVPRLSPNRKAGSLLPLPNCYFVHKKYQTSVKGGSQFLYEVLPIHPSQLKVISSYRGGEESTQRRVGQEQVATLSGRQVGRWVRAHLPQHSCATMLPGVPGTWRLNQLFTEGTYGVDRTQLTTAAIANVCFYETDVI